MQDSPDSKIAEESTSPQGERQWLGSQLQKTIDATYEKYRHVDEGTLATYIPELGKANPNDFGICLVTTEGEVFMAGDWEQEFTIQSVCKPFAFQMALERHGVEEVLKHVGVEPSGDAFNAIELDERSGRPFNPMVNAGAIAVASLIKQEPVDAGIDAFVEKMGKAAGRQLSIDNAVLASETATGNRNRAIAYLLLNGRLPRQFELSACTSTSLNAPCWSTAKTSR